MTCGICGTYCALPGGYGEGVCICVVSFGATTHHRHVCTVCPDGRIQGIVPLNLIDLNDDPTSTLHGPGKRGEGLLFSTLPPLSPLSYTVCHRSFSRLTCLYSWQLQRSSTISQYSYSQSVLGDYGKVWIPYLACKNWGHLRTSQKVWPFSCLS